METFKVLAEEQGWKGDRSSEGSLRANLRAKGQEPYIRPNPLGEAAPLDEARLERGMVNEVVVPGKIMFFPGAICQPKFLNGSGGTEPAKVRVNMAEVSRGREPEEYFDFGERSEGSVNRRCL